MNMMVQFNQLNIADLIKRDGSQYRFIKRIHYCQDKLMVFVDDIDKSMKNLNVKYKLMQANVVIIPNVAHKGYPHIESSSHYAVDIILI